MRNVTFPVIGAVVGTAVAWAAMPWTGRLVDAAIPASRWFEVKAVEAQDARAGRSPVLRVERTIHQDFTADWIVTLRRETEAGYVTLCARRGHNDYRPDAVAPEGADLNWWMDVPPNPPCPEIPPGRYIVTFAWTLEIPGLAPKVVRAASNVFEVTP